MEDVYNGGRVYEESLYLLLILLLKNLPANAEDWGWIPVLGRSPGEENGNPFQYSCLGNPMDKGAWWATAHGVARVRQDLATKLHSVRRGEAFYSSKIRFQSFTEPMP